MPCCKTCLKVLAGWWLSGPEYADTGLCITCYYANPAPALAPVSEPAPPAVCPHTHIGGTGLEWACRLPPHETEEHAMVRRYPHRP